MRRVAVPVGADRTTSAAPETSEAAERMCFSDLAYFEPIFQDPGRLEHMQYARLINQVIKPALPASSLPHTKWHLVDMGAGTGELTFLLARAFPASTVTATDAEPAMVRHLRTKASEQPSNMHVVQAPRDGVPVLSRKANVVVMVATYLHVRGRVGFLRALRDSLEPDGVVILVEYLSGDLAICAPPEHMRISPELALKEFAAAHFKERARYADWSSSIYVQVFERMPAV